MRKKLRSFKQHTMEEYDIGLETCGIACILMLLDLYQRDLQYPTLKLEKKLYDRYRCKSFGKGVTAASAAACLSDPRNALQVRLIHSSTDYLENHDEYFSPELFENYRKEYLDKLCQCRDRITVETGVDFTCADLAQLLKKGKQIMLQCIIPGDADGIHDHVLHWIILYGIREDLFLAVDPLPNGGKIQMTTQELSEYMDTPIGKICLVVSDGC